MNTDIHYSQQDASSHQEDGVMGKLTVQDVQKLTGASWSALRDQYSATAQSMCETAAKARATGKKVRGYTAEHAQTAADEMAARAAECAARAA